jgi:hypothetical protein
MTASDFLELTIAAALLFLALAWRPWIEPLARRLAERTGWCMLFLAALPVALRLFLLGNHPVPAPDVYDEFGHLLVADTLRHFRLANPSHSLHQFFETFFVLQEPTYSSIYPIGQGLTLAIGRMVFGVPWAGVVLSTAALCALCYWMLRAWTTPMWALAGGLLAVFEFGPLSQWMNTYWGGSFAAAGGCLVFGALPRLRDRGSLASGALLGVGLAINLLARPYEGIFLGLSVILFLIPVLRRTKTSAKGAARTAEPDTESYAPRSVLRVTTKRLIARSLPIAAIVLLPTIGITLLQNRRVTGSWTTLPYQLSQFQYGVPVSLTFQPDPVPHRDLTPQQQLEYKAQLAFHSERETIQTYLLRLEYRVRFYRFFFLPPLFIALPFFLWALKERRFQWVLITLLIFALGINFFPAFQLHYLATVTCLFVLMAVTGLERLSRLNPAAARLILFLSIAYFGFWYTLHLFDTSRVSLAFRQYETWDGLNHRNPERRIMVTHQLSALSGKLLVFVRYSPQHIFQEEWVWNDADIDAARIVWARDLGPSENEKLRSYYPDRTTLLLEPDSRTPKLAPYSP